MDRDPGDDVIMTSLLRVRRWSRFIINTKFGEDRMLISLKKGHFWKKPVDRDRGDDVIK